nr:MAG TPA: hypothetical protein [Caudoviricetes sp.]DAU81103.1 MAG TPA: hypothetical protein [Caudoviricetes sp.]
MHLKILSLIYFIVLFPYIMVNFFAYTFFG